jgi:hypothetical protein
MVKRSLLPVLAGFCFALPAQTLKPQTVQEFQAYVQSAESRINARKTFLVVDADPASLQQLMRAKDIQTVLGNGPNPHKITDGMVYDWIGTVFIAGATLDRTVRMLQDYDHRTQYFPDVISQSKLLCRTGENRFGFAMRLKTPAVIDVESDVTWEKVDPHRWRCSSYSTKVQEIGKQHGYLNGMDSFWRFYEAEKGVFVEGHTITLSGEFSSFMRTLGSLVGHDPEKSLKKSLASMRESLQKPGAEFAKPPEGKPVCATPGI